MAKLFDKKNIFFQSLVIIFVIFSTAAFSVSSNNKQKTPICKNEPNFVSPSNGMMVFTTIRNSTNLNLNINWLNNVGDRVLYKVLRPGEFYKQKTNKGHYWLASRVGANGKCLAIKKIYSRKSDYWHITNSSFKTPADYAARCNISVANVKMAQRRLKKLGLYTSTIDGIAGKGTERAFKAAKAMLGNKASAGECFNKADTDAFLLIEAEIEKSRLFINQTLIILRKWARANILDERAAQIADFLAKNRDIDTQNTNELEQTAKVSKGLLGAIEIKDDTNMGPRLNIGAIQKVEDDRLAAEAQQKVKDDRQAGKGLNVALVCSGEARCRYALEIVAEVKSPKQSPLKKKFIKLSATKRKQIQTNLKDLGFYNSSIDGLFGKGTAEAISRYNNEKLNGTSLEQSVFVGIVLNRILSLKPPVSSRVEITTNICGKTNHSKVLCVQEAESLVDQGRDYKRVAAITKELINGAKDYRVKDGMNGPYDTHDVINRARIELGRLYAYGFGGYQNTKEALDLWNLVLQNWRNAKPLQIDNAKSLIKAFEQKKRASKQQRVSNQLQEYYQHYRRLKLCKEVNVITYTEYKNAQKAIKTIEKNIVNKSQNLDTEKVWRDSILSESKAYKEVHNTVKTMKNLGVDFSDNPFAGICRLTYTGFIGYASKINPDDGLKKDF